MYNTAPISSHALSLAPMRVDTRSLSTVSCVAVCSAEPLPCPCVLGRCLSCPRLSCCVGYKHHNVTLSLARAARTHRGSAARWRPCCAPAPERRRRNYADARRATGTARRRRRRRGPTAPLPRPLWKLRRASRLALGRRVEACSGAARPHASRRARPTTCRAARAARRGRSGARERRPGLPLPTGDLCARARRCHLGRGAAPAAVAARCGLRHQRVCNGCADLMRTRPSLRSPCSTSEILRAGSSEIRASSSEIPPSRCAPRPPPRVTRRRWPARGGIRSRRLRRDGARARARRPPAPCPAPQGSGAAIARS